MKLDIDFNECVLAYAEEHKKLYYHSVENLKGPMLILLEAALNYEEAAGIALDLLESVPDGYRQQVMEDRGYFKAEDELEAGV